jgi:hypothetical protein
MLAFIESPLFVYYVLAFYYVVNIFFWMWLAADKNRSMYIWGVWAVLFGFLATAFLMAEPLISVPPSEEKKMKAKRDAYALLLQEKIEDYGIYNSTCDTLALDRNNKESAELLVKLEALKQC